MSTTIEAKVLVRKPLNVEGKNDEGETFTKEGLTLVLDTAVASTKACNWDENSKAIEWKECTSYQIDISWRQLTFAVMLDPAIQAILVASDRKPDHSFIFNMLEEATLEIVPVFHACGEIDEDGREYHSDKFTYDLRVVKYGQNNEKLVEMYRPKERTKIEDLWS